MRYRITESMLRRLIFEAVASSFGGMPSEFYDALDAAPGAPFKWHLPFDWFSKYVRKGVCLVSLNGRYAYYDRNENRYIIDMCFDEGSKPFHRDDYTRVKLNGKYNMLRIDGTFLFSEWFDYIDVNTWGPGTFCILFNDSSKYVILDESGQKVHEGELPFDRGI